MVFTNSIVPPELEKPLPEDIDVGDFVLEASEALSSAGHHVRDPFVLAPTGDTRNIQSIQNRVDLVSRGLSKKLGWGSERVEFGEKVIGFLAYNSIDYIPLTWAAHRVGATCLLLHPTSSPAEITVHLERVKCTAVFVQADLVSKFQTAVAQCPSAKPKHIFLLDSPGEQTEGGDQYETVEQLIDAANVLEPLPRLIHNPNKKASDIAYLCATSGTSGSQKLAKITHLAIMYNIVQCSVRESIGDTTTEVALGILPMSHLYGLLCGHNIVYRGQCMIVHATLDIKGMLESIARYKIQHLYVVPTIVAALTQYSFLLDAFDLSSIQSIAAGAAPFTETLANRLYDLRPNWAITPGYGLTESGGVVSLTVKGDFTAGSGGSLLPLVEVRLVDSDGVEVAEYDKRGEIYIRSPTNFAGYLHDAASNEGLFTSDGFLRTGDVGLFRLSASGVEHLFIVDRLKDMIKVKGLQVAPVDLENYILLHPAVKDVAVVGIEDVSVGERPKAFIVRSTDVQNDLSESELKKSINAHVEAHFSDIHWLGNRIEFRETLPRSGSGKILKWRLKQGLQ